MANATVQVNVRIEPTLYRQVKRLAETRKVTVTAVVNEALEALLKGAKP